MIYMGKQEHECFGLNDDRPMACPATSPKYHGSKYPDHWPI